MNNVGDHLSAVAGNANDSLAPEHNPNHVWQMLYEW